MGKKEKAKELIEKFYNKQIEVLNKHLTTPLNEIELEIAKESALICVDEMLHVSWFTHKNKIEYRYWQNVKTEIENYES